MKLPDCPWCNKEISTIRWWSDPDPTFVYFLNCECNIRKGLSGFLCKVDQSDEYRGFEIELATNEKGYLKLVMDIFPDKEPEYIINLYTQTKTGFNIETLLTVSGKELNPTEAKLLLFKYKKLLVFV